MSTTIYPFHLAIPDADLTDLQTRLAHTRWPDPETVGDTSQGPQLAKLQALVARWQDGYDWRRCEALLNSWGQYHTEIDGLDIHFLHIRSPEPTATPLLITHGWPGSVLEFRDVIGPLTDPVAHGGQASDAFHLVIPSLPGFGFSGKPTATGWNLNRIADAWIVLMARLGYDQWTAQGGDWGGAVTTALGYKAPPGLRGIHVNMVMFQSTEQERAEATPHEQKMLDDAKRYDQQLSGSRGPGSLDLRHVPGCVRQRLQRGKRVRARHHHRQHHAVLAAEHRREFGAPVLGDDAIDAQRRHAERADGNASRHQHVPRRAAAPVTALGRKALYAPGAFQ
jgi:pimeloyl-ACP methyl ester carboxylesterase